MSTPPVMPWLARGMTFSAQGPAQAHPSSKSPSVPPETSRGLHLGTNCGGRTSHLVLPRCPRTLVRKQLSDRPLRHPAVVQKGHSAAFYKKMKNAPPPSFPAPEPLHVEEDTALPQRGKGQLQLETAAFNKGYRRASCRVTVTTRPDNTRGSHRFSPSQT